MALFFSVPANAGSCGLGAEPPDDAPRTVDAFRERHQERFHIVNAREMIDGNGSRIPGAQATDWTLDFHGNNGALPEEPDNSLIVIFVHGYCTSLGDGMRDAEGLRANLMQAEPLNAPSSFSFYAFLWKGDFGEAEFGTAQAAADATAPSLASLIQQLAERGHKIVLIAHSLGGRVVLESLLNLPPRDRPWIDSLVLVQAAVPATDVARWTMTNILSETEPVVRCSGRYADAIRDSRQIVYSFSARDMTLYNWFSGYEFRWPTHQKCDLPSFDDLRRTVFSQGNFFSMGGVVRATALGSPFESTAEELLPPLRPTVRLEIKPLDPFGRIARSTLTDSLTTIPETLYRYEFSCDHPDCESVNLDTLPGDFASITDWHSPIFVRGGAPIVWALWRRVSGPLRRP